MKQFRTTTLLAAAIVFAFGACEKKIDEKTAIANFKTEVEGVSKWAEERQKSAATDPSAGMAVMGEIVEKFKGIKTDGLPSDLKTAWGEMGAVMGELGDLLKSMPKFDASKPAEMSKVMQEFMPKMMAIHAKGEPIAKTLEEIGKKYGLDMKKIGPGGK